MTNSAQAPHDERYEQKNGLAVAGKPVYVLPIYKIKIKINRSFYSRAVIKRPSFCIPSLIRSGDTVTKLRRKVLVSGLFA